MFTVGWLLGSRAKEGYASFSMADADASSAITCINSSTSAMDTKGQGSTFNACAGT